jgi:hypothetical protein
MGKRDYHETQTYTNIAPPDTPDIQALRGFNVNDDLLEPTLNAQFAHAQTNLENEYDSPYSGINNPYASARLKDLGRMNLMAQKGSALAQGAFNRQQLELAKQEALARLTAPQLVQTGKSGTAPGQSILGSLIQGAGSVAGGFAAAGML